MMDVTLVELKKNTKARIVAIACNAEQTLRLHAVGICPNAEIEKIEQTSAKGPILVTTAQSCNFAIGHDLAVKIFVR